MRWVCVLLAFSALTACGADGEPVTPSVNAGVTVNENGVFPGLGLGLSKGPFAVAVNL